MAQVRTLERRLALRRDTGRTPINLGRASLRQVIDPAVAAVFDVEIADLRAPTRSSPQAAFGGDNSLGPDILIGKYDRNTEAETMLFQYCVRPSNDWPPEYTCDHSVKFNKVSSCN